MKKILVCVVAVVAGCGANPTFQQFETESVQIQCEFYFKCCPATKMTYTSVQDCELQNADQTNVDALQASIAEKALRYDSSAASSCLSRLHSLYSSCTKTVTDAQSAPIEAECDDVLSGVLKKGQSCSNTDNISCESGLYCNDATSVCASYTGDGSTCGTTVECSPKSYCDTTTKKCAALKSGGADCADPDECISGNCDTGTCIDLPQPVTNSCPSTQTN